MERDMNTLIILLKRKANKSTFQRSSRGGNIGIINYYFLKIVLLIGYHPQDQ